MDVNIHIIMPPSAQGDHESKTKGHSKLKIGRKAAHDTGNS